MAVLAVAATGAVVGGGVAAGMGAAVTTGIALGWSVGAMVGNTLFGGVDAPDAEGPRINDLTVQSSSYGEPIPLIYGSVRIAGNVIWATDLREHKHTESSGGGKGGGGGGSTTTTYTYSVSYATALCEGPVTFGRIWMDGKLFRDSEGEYNEGNIDGLHFYSGTEDQEPDPIMESDKGTVPAYKGTAYIVFEDLQLGDYGNSIPNTEVEVFFGETPTTDGAIISDIFERANIAPENYDVATLDNECHGFAVTRPLPAKEIIRPLMQAYNLDVVEAEGGISVLPRGQSDIDRSFFPQDLGATESGSDQNPSITAKRLPQEDLPTKVVVEYQDKDMDYQTNTQASKREALDYSKTKQIRLPLVLSASKAIKIANIALASVWAEGVEYTITTTIDGVDIIPGSVIQVYSVGNPLILVSTTSVQMPSMVEIKGV